MTEEQLPKLFQDYWKIQEKPPKPDAPSKKENLSEDWKRFLGAIKKRVEQDLNKT